MGSKRTASLARVIGGAVGVLSLLGIGTLGFSAVDSLNRYREASEIQKFDAGVNKFVAGLYETLMERLYTNNGLQAAEPASPAVQAQIAAARKTIRENFEPGLAALKEQEFPGKSGLLLALETTRAKANDYRSQADRALTLPRDQRDENLRKTFIPVVTDSVNAALKVWFAALHTSAAEDAILSRLANIKEIGWRMRDYSGRERSNISQAIAGGTPISAEHAAANATWRKSVEIQWEMLENLTGDPATHPAIKNAMATARDQYFGGFVRLAEEMKKASVDGAKYSMPPAQYVETTTAQVATLLKVMYVAGEASEARTADLKSAALRSLIIDGCLIAVCIVMVGAVSVVINRRVTGSLKAMTSTMNALAGGQMEVEIPFAQRRDEIGEMAAALHKFRDGMIEADRLRAAQDADKQRQLERGQHIEAGVVAFESAVGDVVKAVTAAATELQSTAKAMSATAEQTSQQSTMAAAA
jgi:HAMP domain-containing protein